MKSFSQNDTCTQTFAAPLFTTVTGREQTKCLVDGGVERVSVGRIHTTAYVKEGKSRERRMSRHLGQRGWTWKALCRVK